MRILNKIVDNGVIVGYRVEDDAFVLPLCKKALFLDMYIEPLIRDGYKYYGYDADLIEDPNGNPITDLPEVLLSDQDEMEWFASVNLADQSALTDADASRYYTFRESSVMEFRREDSYEINTREQLVQYLLGLERALFTASFSTDNRPLNSFVNPDALFTINELSNDPDVRHYFQIIVRRHHFRNFAAYQQLVGWLYEKGAIKTQTPSLAEFIAGYYSWGPEGIKDKCTGYELKMNVDGTFEFMKDSLQSNDPVAYVMANRTSKVGVIDGTDTIHFLKNHQDVSQIADIKDFQRSPIALPSNDKLLTLRRRQATGKKYIATTQTMVSDVSDRVYFTLVTENGYTYTYKASHNKIKIGLTHTNTNSEIFSSGENFGIASIVSSVCIPLDKVSSSVDYYLWNLAILKSAQLIERKSKKAPFKTTSEYLITDGVSPIAAVDLIATAIKKNSGYQSNRKYALSDKEDDLIDALELYMQEIPPYILKAYQILPEDITEGMQTFLELADVDDLKDRRDEMMAMRIGPNDPGFDPTFKDYESKIGRRNIEAAAAAAMLGKGEKMIDAVDYYTKIKFVDDCIHGAVAVDNFGDGITDDIGANYGIAAECILSVIYAEYGNEPDLKTAEQAIVFMENSDLIDINNIFRMRDHAWKGFMVDFAEYRRMRAAADTWAWAYCTKVFREISNAPIAEQRPYLMELVILEHNKQDLPTRKLMTECVRQAIEKADFSTERFDDEGLMSNWSEKKVILSSADYVAAKLFFFIYAGGVKSDPVDGNYIIPLELQAGVSVNIELPVAVYDFVRSFNVESHKRYITVYDYCKYEYDTYNKARAFNFCLVNADVDPWHVRPKKGFRIKTYSLLPNYYDQNALDTANGENFYLEARNSGGICVAPFKGSYKSLFLPYDGNGGEDILQAERDCKFAESLSDMEVFLDYKIQEYVFAYVKRWALAKKYAMSIGKKLYSIPLKQDIVYAEFAYSYCEKLPEQNCVFVDDDVSFNDRAAQTSTDVGAISWKDFVQGIGLITTKSTKVYPFTIRDVDMNDIERMAPILSGQFQCELPIVVSGNYLVIKDDSLFRVPVTRIDEGQMSQFIRDGVLFPISESKYFIRAINGDYVLEV